MANTIDRHKLTCEVLDFLGFKIGRSKCNPSFYTVLWKSAGNDVWFMEKEDSCIFNFNCKIKRELWLGKFPSSIDILKVVKDKIVNIENADSMECSEVDFVKRWTANPFYGMSDEQISIFLDLNMD